MGFSSIPSAAELLALLVLVLQLSLIVAVLQPRRVRRWWKQLKRWRKAKRARSKEQSASPGASAGAEIPTLTREMWIQRQMSDMERVSLRAPLASMESLGSLSGSSSISMGSVYSFLEPWNDAMPELAALDSSGRPRSPKTVEAPWEERGPALGQDPLLAEPEHERVPADAEDAELPLSSHPPMSTTTRQLLRNFVNAVYYAEAVAKQHRQLLQGKLGQWREPGGGCREACGRTLPEEPSLPSTSLDADVRKAAGGDEGTARDTATERSSPTQLGRSSPTAGKRSSPAQPERSRSTGPGCSSRTNSDRSSPTELGRSSPRDQRSSSRMGRDRAAPGLCKAGRCLREGCTWLWGWMKALCTSCF